jgi:hypothetical protein
VSLSANWVQPTAQQIDVEALCSVCVNDIQLHPRGSSCSRADSCAWLHKRSGGVLTLMCSMSNPLAMQNCGKQYYPDDIVVQASRAAHSADSATFHVATVRASPPPWLHRSALSARRLDEMTCVTTKEG